MDSHYFNRFGEVMPQFGFIPPVEDTGPWLGLPPKYHPGSYHKLHHETNHPSHLELLHHGNQNFTKRRGKWVWPNDKRGRGKMGRLTDILTGKGPDMWVASHYGLGP